VLHHLAEIVFQKGGQRADFAAGLAGSVVGSAVRPSKPVVMVGDRGMITAARLGRSLAFGLDWITSHR
jgi:hypothetical protein